jgi:hypothetical protein
MRRASRDTLFLATAGLMGTMQLFATATVLWATTRPAHVPAPVVVYTTEIRASEPRPAAMPVRDRVTKVTQAMAPAKRTAAQEQDRISEDVVRMTLQQALRALRSPEDSQGEDALLEWEPVLTEERARVVTGGALAENLRNRWESRADPWADNANGEAYDDAEPLLTAELSNLFASGLGGRGGLDLSGLLNGGLGERFAGLGEGGGFGALSEAGGALAALRERLGDRGEDEANLADLLEREEGLLSDRQRRALLLVGLLAAERRRDPAAP